MFGNKTTLSILVLLFVAFFLYHKPIKNISVPDTPSVIIPKPTPVPEPIPVIENGCDLSLTRALQTNKKLLIIFVADWCGFCKKLKNDLIQFENMDKYIICLVNIDEDPNKELINHFNIKMVPTSIMVDPEKNVEIKRISGYNKDKYIAWIK